MSNLDALLKYVRTGTTEGDKSFLGQVFVSPQQLTELVGIEPGGMRILVGNKGMGKSAISEWINSRWALRKLPCLLLRPDDLDTKDLGQAQDIGSLKRHFYNTLVVAAAAAVGSKLSGFLVGDAAKLHTEAKKKGLVPDDLIQKSLALLSAISVPVANINGVQLAKELTGEKSPNDLIKAINTHLLSSPSKLMFLIIDDTDQVASPSEPTHLNRIWALLLAIRKLAAESPNIRAIVTLRTEIWARLISESEGQRDQADHLRGIVVNLRADDDFMRKIIQRRMERAAGDLGKMNQDPYPLFFVGNTVTLPTSTEVRTWDSFIIKSSRERPRDALQLIKNMIDRSKANGTHLIGSDEANQAMEVYSRERVDDLYNEFSPDCENIRMVLKSFVDVNFEVDFETLRQHLKTISSRFHLNIRGEVMKSSQDRDVVKILSLLHEAGFINAKIPDAQASRGFRHILFYQNPNFVKYANWNEMQAANWEIHPAFRSWLLAEKKDAFIRH